MIVGISMPSAPTALPPNFEITRFFKTWFYLLSNPSIKYWIFSGSSKS
jgi:hypothetical protein